MITGEELSKYLKILPTCSSSKESFYADHGAIRDDKL